MTTIDLAAARRARELSAARPGSDIAARVNAMAMGGADLQEVEGAIAGDLARSLARRRGRTSLLANTLRSP
jgi:hypothetical protein